MPHRAPSSLIILAAGLAGCSPAPDATAFIEFLGRDTMAVEVFTRTEDAIEGQLILRTPVTQVATYRASLTDDGLISRLVTQWDTPAENPQGPESFQTDLSLTGDSAVLVVTGGRNPRRQTLPTPEGRIFLEVGRIPYSMGVFDQMVRAALASGEPRYEFSVLQPGGAGLSRNYVARESADTVSTGFFGNPIYAGIAENGGVTGRTGIATTYKAIARPVNPASIDVAALAARFAARDARGEGLGVASPTDTVSVASDGTELTVVYSRPAKRGRTIWGGLVPWNRVWRTGANAATHFSTTGDLQIGGNPLPAGLYTLWTTFTPDGGTLIVSAETGQWGTAYKPEHDLFRVALTREPLDPPAERFTIAIEPAGDGATLSMAWDDARYSVPIRF